MQKISIKGALGFSFSFFFRNIGAIVVRLALPALAGWCVFYASASLYLSELQAFLGVPSDRSGSLILGLVAAGLLALLFLHAMIVSGIAALAMGHAEDGQFYFRAQRREWRLYAANLRLLLVVMAVVGGVILIRSVLLGFSNGVWLGPVGNIVIIAGVFVLSIRGAFLIPPIVVAEPRGQIVRRSERLSRGDFWRIAAIVVVPALLGLVIEMIGESTLRAIGIFQSPSGLRTLADIVVMYGHILPGISLLISLAYLVSVVLITLASTFVYRQLTEQAAP